MLVLATLLWAGGPFRAGEPNATPETTALLVPRHDLTPGMPILEENLVPHELPSWLVADSVLHSHADLVGRVPRERLLAGEPVREERLAGPNAVSGIRALLPPEMRALTINVSEASATAGFIQPGNYVDLLVASTAGPQQVTESRILLRAAKVLAINDARQSTGGDRSIPPSVTLAFPSIFAQRLSDVPGPVSVTLALRSDVDVTGIDTHGSLAPRWLGGVPGSAQD